MGLNKIIIEIADANRALELKRDLEQGGLLVDRDFTWHYHPAHYEWENNNHTPAWVEFIFENESLSSYYRIKWL